MLKASAKRQLSIKNILSMSLGSRCAKPYVIGYKIDHFQAIMDNMDPVKIWST